MDSRYKGFQYITLTHDKHHVDFVTVPWGSRDYSINCEYAFDLYSTGAHSLSYALLIRLMCIPPTLCSD
jgi:hypothetical protein